MANIWFFVIASGIICIISGIYAFVELVKFLFLLAKGKVDEVGSGTA